MFFAPHTFSLLSLFGISTSFVDLFKDSWLASKFLFVSGTVFYVLGTFISFTNKLGLWAEKPQPYKISIYLWSVSELFWLKIFSSKLHTFNFRCLFIYVKLIAFLKERICYDKCLLIVNKYCKPTWYVQLYGFTHFVGYIYINLHLFVFV